MLKHNTIRRTLAGGLVLAAASFPATTQARRMPDVPFGPGPVIQTAAPQPVTHAGQPGFQWGDAGIGAGTALLLSAGVAGAAMTRRRVRRPAVG